MHAKLAQAAAAAGRAAGAYALRPKSSASGACRTAPRAAKRALEDQLDAAFDFYHKEVEQRHWYGFWNYRRRDAPARWRAPRVALRHRRLRLGQHRTGHRPVALVHLPAHRPRRRLPHGGGHDAPHQRSRHLSPGPLRHARARATTCATGAAAPRRRASARPPTGASTTT